MKIKAALDFGGLFQTILPTYITSKTCTRTHNSKNVAKVIQRRIRREILFVKMFLLVGSCKHSNAKRTMFGKRK